MVIAPVVDLLLPQEATINGTVLRVGTRRIDLATASAARVSRPKPPQVRVGSRQAYDAVLLEAWQDVLWSPVSLVLTLGGVSLFRAEHLRLLARILAERTWPPGRSGEDSRYAVTFLTELAERVDRDNDWSFRAGPMTDRRTAPGKYT